MKGSLRKYLPITIIYFAVLLLTRYTYFGDSPGYIDNIVAYDRTSNPALIWEFGHLLWRPFGWALFHMFGGLISGLTAGDPLLEASALLLGASAIGGLVTILLLRWLASHFVASDWIADLIAASFLCFYSFLNYLHTGCVYVFGLMWLTLAVACVIKAFEAGARRALYIAGAGVSSALSVLFWFPYAFVLPGVVATAFFWKSGASSRERLRMVIVITACAAAVIGVGYAAAIAILHLDSLAQIKAWVLASGHGWSQSKRLLRMVIALPRSFVWVGDEGMLIKRYLLHDPYAPVTLGQIVRQQLWRVLFFYGFAAALVWTLMRSKSGRRMFLLLACASAPLLFFAAFIFESSSAERYLPLFPFLCLAIAFCLSQAGHWIPRAVVLLFLCVAIVSNIQVTWGGTQLGRYVKTEQRARSIREKVGPGSVVALDTLMDDLYMYAADAPYDPLRPERRRIPVYDVVQIGNDRVLTWREEFAARSLKALDSGQSVWVSKRLLAQRPDPAWGWNEGDDARVGWRDLPQFFSRFEYAEDVGGPDGFLRLDDSPRNRQLLEAAQKGPVQAARVPRARSSQAH